MERGPGRGSGDAGTLGRDGWRAGMGVQCPVGVWRNPHPGDRLGRSQEEPGWGLGFGLSSAVGGSCGKSRK